jgi:RHS repeat-associated protein
LLIFGFSSERFDADNCIVYYIYRYYDASLGRWTKRDPCKKIPKDVMLSSLNLYVVVENSPISDSDYLGLNSLTIQKKVKSTEASPINVPITQYASLQNKKINPSIVDFVSMVFNIIDSEMNKKTKKQILTEIGKKCGESKGNIDCCCTLSILYIKNTNPDMPPFLTIYNVIAEKVNRKCDEVSNPGAIFPSGFFSFYWINWKCCK